MREICSVWLGGNGDTGQGLGLKTLLKLDTSVCNKQLRQSLLDVLSYQDWETILTGHAADRTGLRMRWVVARQIALPKLVLSNFPNDQDTIRSFFKCNGKLLKVLKLSDFKGAMTLLTKAIASYCKVLETLSLERCNLTMPIADILNKTSTIKEARFQNRPISYRSRAARHEGVRGVKTVLFDKVTCLSVTKLALLDPVHLDDAEVISRAFPNVKDFEMHNSNGDVLVRLLGSWKDVETLRLMSMKDMGGTVIPDVFAKVRQSVKTVVVQYSNQWLANSSSLLLNLDNLTSVTLAGYFRNEPLLVARLAERCSQRLEVLNVCDMHVTQEDVAAVAEHCPNLRVLSMHYLGSCSNYHELLSKCARLEKLRVAPWYRYVGNVHTSNSEELLTSIATLCYNLHFLSFMTQECDVTLIPCDLLSNCPKLRVFETQCYKWKNLVGKIKGVEVRPFPVYNVYDALQSHREF